ARSKFLWTSRLPVFTPDDFSIRFRRHLVTRYSRLLWHRRARRRIDVLFRPENANRVDVETIPIGTGARNQVVGFPGLAAHEHVVGRRAAAAGVLHAPIGVGSLRVVAAVPVVQSSDRAPEERDPFVAR